MFIGASPLRAQCPGPIPQDQEDANSNPVYIAQCSNTGPGGGCPIPAAPDILSVDAQEAIVSAIAPFTAERVYWRAYEKDANGFFQLVWDYISSENAPYLKDTQVTFGAPGFKEGKDIRFEVAFCDDTECFCWSDPGAIAQTLAFSGSAPDPIATNAQEIEAIFEVPQTTSMQAGGDGLGPVEAWVSGGYIADDKDPATIGGTVFLPLSAGMVRSANSKESHAYSEAWVRNELSGLSIAEGYEAADYNIDVSVRTYGTSTQGFGYYVKLAFEDQYNDGKKTLTLGYLSGGNRHEYLLPGEFVEIQQTIPLDTEDANRTDASEAVLLRIEVDDNLGAGESVITGYLAWDCSSGPITNCTNVIQVGPLTDSDAQTHGLLGVKGMPGVSAHHTGHYVDSFKAGSTAPPP
jgi:hypothetical protein